MSYLLDTHALLWWLDGDARLSAKARTLIGDAGESISVSAASAWEISTKVRIGRLPNAVPIVHRLPEIVGEQGFIPLAITIAHAAHAGRIESDHRDPFDRMFAAQALLEGLVLISKDPCFEALGAPAVW